MIWDPPHCFFSSFKKRDVVSDFPHNIGVAVHDSPPPRISHFSRSFSPPPKPLSPFRQKTLLNQRSPFLNEMADGFGSLRLASFFFLQTVYLAVLRP